MTLSPVTENRAATAEQAYAHFAAKLSFEADPADVASAMQEDNVDFLLIDTRAKGHYTKSHLPGAINVPQTGITAEWLAQLPADRLLIAYCWGPACNGSTKAAMKIAALGRPVKELIGGFQYWVREGWPTEGKRPLNARVSAPAITDLGLFA